MNDDQSTYIGKRFEFKYLLSPQKAAVVERHLCTLSNVTSDPHSSDGPYTVNSLYFDTPTLSDYREKDGSFLQRKKLRARIYEETWTGLDTPVWLEIKHKHNMNVSKERVVISSAEWQQFADGYNGVNLPQYARKDNGALRSFRYRYQYGRYRPATVVRYLRSAYVENFTSLIRVSFDKNVCVSLPGGPSQQEDYIPVTRNLVIMEIKFYDKMPWWFKQLVGEYQLSRTDFSKYRNSAAVLRWRYRIPVAK